MFEIVDWNEKLDLESFYNSAAERGFVNNSSQEKMIDCFRNEKEWHAWILYKDDLPIGSVAAHSFDDVMGENSFRILTRTCSFSEYSPCKGLITPKKLVAEHQNFTDQFLLPTCLDWVNNRGRVFATSNSKTEGSQRLVHKFYFPTLEKLGIVSKIKDVYYRYTYQTVWQIHPNKFFENLNRDPRWQ
jgi:hypothetical protein